MKIETTIRDDHQADLSVEVEPESLEKAKRKAARLIAKKVKIPGFRPGKAPYQVIQKQIGEAAIMEDALEILIDDVYPQILEEADIDPYGPGSLKDVSNLEPPTLEITIPLAPVVDLGDYRAVRMPFKEKKVTKKDIDKVISNLQEKQAIVEPVERPAEENDMVTVLLSADRKEADGQKKKMLIEERSVPIVIEKEETDSTDEWPYPGYSRSLIGKSPEDKIKSEFQFPEDYIQSDLQNVAATFQTVVKEVKARTLPGLDDEFAKSAGDYDTFDQLAEEVSKSLTTSHETDQNSEYENKMIDKIIEGATFKFPPQMIEHEISHQQEDLIRNLTAQGLDMDVYLKSREMDKEALQEEFRPGAEERIKRGLTLIEIAKVENIEVTPAEVEEKKIQTIEEIKRLFPEEESNKLLTDEYIESLSRNIVNDEIASRTLERVRAIGKGEADPVEVSKEKLPKKKKTAKKSSRTDK